MDKCIITIDTVTHRLRGIDRVARLKKLPISENANIRSMEYLKRELLSYQRANKRKLIAPWVLVTILSVIVILLVV